VEPERGPQPLALPGRRPVALSATGESPFLGESPSSPPLPRSGGHPSRRPICGDFTCAMEHSTQVVVCRVATDPTGGGLQRSVRPGMPLAARPGSRWAGHALRPVPSRRLRLVPAPLQDAEEQVDRPRGVLRRVGDLGRRDVDPERVGLRRREGPGPLVGCRAGRANRTAGVDRPQEVAGTEEE
jgi:hypothetical protein